MGQGQERQLLRKGGVVGRHTEAIVAFAAGFLLCGALIYVNQPPSREDLLEEIGQEIEDEVPGTQTEVTREEPAGDILYVSMRKARPQDDYVGLARIEIGYEGQILASLWDSGSGYYAYHFNESIAQNELVEAVRKAAAERSKK